MSTSSRETPFSVIAEPSRRAILGRLARVEHTVGELEQALALSQPSVSKHLRVLREAGLVEARVDAQRRVYRLRAEPLREIDEWLAPFRALWGKHIDALERHLDQMRAKKVGRKRMARSKPTKRSRGAT